jgi:hypothetical protein
MSLGITIDIPDPATLPSLLAIGRGVQNPELRQAAGRGITNALVDHFDHLESTRPNKLGGKRTHFWAKVAAAVHQPELVGGDGVKVAIDHAGAAQRYFGGTIRPTKKQWLSLPARTEAYGNDARKHKDLHFVLFRRGLAALVQNQQTSLAIGRRRKDGSRKISHGETTGGGIFFWLVKEVHQQPDKTVLPAKTELIRAALEGGEQYIKNLLASLAR